MTMREIRQAYLDFFSARGHQILPSASLLPENDATTLFTGSGMQPMVPYLLGEPHPKGTRLADVQKCFRAGDIEEVGDNRHTTFFEMLGNWSLGDYFKKEQVGWMFAFLTRELNLDPARLYVTVFRGNDQVPRDEETVLLWKDAFVSAGIEAAAVDFSERDGLQGGRIFYYDEKKNWWSRSGVPSAMPVGEPGGPDTEMFWDFGPERRLHEASAFVSGPCHVNCDCGRFIEIGNNVFMQYLKTEDGFDPLPKQNVDFGGGLERLAAAVADDPDMFRIDVFDRARERIEQVTRVSYQPETFYAFRVILDHLRAATFLIADGVAPSNKDQGYYVRRLIRRAVRFGNKIGAREAFCGTIADAYIETYLDAYPELAEGRDRIVEEMTKEEAKFKASLEKGLREFEKLFSSRSAVSGVDAFNLYQSYGFPWELTEELAREKGQPVDRAVFQEEFKKHQDLSRAGSQQKFAGGLADHSEEVVRGHTATHLLHQALRTVLGAHIEQKGSNITPERLRFDFSHPQKMTDEEKARVEAIVNEQIQKDLPVHYEMLDLEEAKRRGAIGLFEDKYAALSGKLKVYFIGDEATAPSFSREVCGGPHVESTGVLGTFTIQKEEAVASGIRRIKAVLG
ncbi:alanine--tRNA ligase [Candidatus Uhrbacteria bacterium]|nr:alanine--tRNA ligase [Candidatus Uhrbacteria bacterium]